MENILVTGAAGFLGGRVVERLRDESNVKITAGIRSWKGCARVARLGVEMVKCDVTDPASVERAMTNVTTVIHCAMSDGPSIVAGTRNVLRAARDCGIRKVVHLSTGDVYSAQAGAITESAERQMTGDWYSDSKRQAETVCQEFVDGGLAVSWLRPGIVYGPFCYPWTQRIGLRLMAGQVALLPDQANGVCNAVFVDDVVEACAKLRTPGVGDGLAFNINGSEHLTWNDFFEAYSKALAAPSLMTAKEGKTPLKSALLQPLRVTAKSMLTHFQGPIMALYARNRYANLMMKKLESALRATPESRELAVYARRTHFDDTLIRNAFPDLPRTSLPQGLSIAAGYMRNFGMVDEKAP